MFAFENDMPRAHDNNGTLLAVLVVVVILLPIELVRLQSREHRL